jgi:hypothetical protein
VGTPADRRALDSTVEGAINWTVVDNWPAFVPVARAEIEVLETFLGPLLDQFLGGDHATE